MVLLFDEVVFDSMFGEFFVDYYIEVGLSGVVGVYI